MKHTELINDIDRLLNLSSNACKNSFIEKEGDRLEELNDLLYDIKRALEKHIENYVEPAYEEDNTEDYLLSKRGDEDDI